MYELWGKGGKPDSGWGQGGSGSGRGQCPDYRELICGLLDCWTLGMCYPQQSSDGKRRFLCGHGVAMEAAVPASEGHRGWPVNALGCLLRVDSIILTRNRSLWSNSPWPLRNKAQSFYHRVLKRNSKSSWKRTLRKYLVILANICRLSPGSKIWKYRLQGKHKFPARADPPRVETVKSWGPLKKWIQK